MAAQTDTLEILQLLLSDKRTKVDLVSPIRGSVLHLSACVGSFRACQMLLLNKAPLKVVDGMGKSPMDVALTPNIRTLF